MKIIRPIDQGITELGISPTFVSSVVPEDDHPIWRADITYAIGDLVIVNDPGVHKIYESLGNGNSGNYPPDSAESITPEWLELGPTNRWGMLVPQLGTETRVTERNYFDVRIDSTAYKIDSTLIKIDTTKLFIYGNDVFIEAVIAPTTGVNSVAMFGLEADEVRVVMTDPIEGIVYDETVELSDPTVVALLGPESRVDRFVLTDLPDDYPNAEIKVTITGDGTAPVACSLFIAGNREELGITNHGTSVGILDYSRKEVDEFGRPVIVERAFSDRATFDVTIDTNMVDFVRRVLAKRRARATVYVGQEDARSTLIYGFYRDFDIIYSNFATSACAIEIEGLI